MKQTKETKEIKDIKETKEPKPKKTKKEMKLSKKQKEEIYPFINKDEMNEIKRESKSFEGIQQGVLIALLNVLGFSFEFKRPERYALKTTQYLVIKNIFFNGKKLDFGNTIEIFCEQKYKNEIEEEMSSNQMKTIKRRKDLNRAALSFNWLVDYCEQNGFTLAKRSTKTSKKTLQMEKVNEIAYDENIIISQQQMTEVGKQMNHYIISQFVKEEKTSVLPSFHPFSTYLVTSTNEKNQSILSDLINKKGVVPKCQFSNDGDDLNSNEKMDENEIFEKIENYQKCDFNDLKETKEKNKMNQTKEMKEKNDYNDLKKFEIDLKGYNEWKEKNGIKDEKSNEKQKDVQQPFFKPIGQIDIMENEKKMMEMNYYQYPQQQMIYQPMNSLNTLNSPNTFNSIYQRQFGYSQQQFLNPEMYNMYSNNWNNCLSTFSDYPMNTNDSTYMNFSNYPNNQNNQYTLTNSIITQSMNYNQNLTNTNNSNSNMGGNTMENTQQNQNGMNNQTNNTNEGVMNESTGNNVDNQNSTYFQVFNYDENENYNIDSFINYSVVN